MNATLFSSVQYLKGIGPQRAEQLQKIGLKTLEDVLFYFPRRYQDRSEILPEKSRLRIKDCRADR